MVRINYYRPDGKYKDWGLHLWDGAKTPTEWTRPFAQTGQSSYGALTQSFASQAAFDAARAKTSYFGRTQEIVAPRVLKIGFKLDF